MRETTTLTYFHSGGEVVAHRFPKPVVLTPAEAFLALTGHLRAMSDAAEAQDAVALSYHSRRERDLIAAMRAASRWALCMTPQQEAACP